MARQCDTGQQRQHITAVQVLNNKQLQDGHHNIPYLMSALLKLRQLEGEPHALLLLAWLLQVGCHVHVNLTQPVDDVMRRVAGGTDSTHSDAINVQYNLCSGGTHVTAFHFCMCSWKTDRYPLQHLHR